MEGDDFSSFWSCSICDLCLDRRAHVLLPRMAACEPLPQAMGAATVSSNSRPKSWEALTMLQYYPGTLHGSHLCHGFLSILPLLPTCCIL